MLERHRIAERWRSERWDGLKFQFPNWSVRLPEFSFPHADPDAFRDHRRDHQFHRGLRALRRSADPLRRRGDAALAPTMAAPASSPKPPDGAIAASHVVVATGPYQRPLMPDLLRDENALSGARQPLRKSKQLPPGAVLVIGSGASGVQIAEELRRAGRRVLLSVGRNGRLPRRYRGSDLVRWIAEMGIDETPVERRDPSRPLPTITGAYGGYTIDFRRFAADGVTLLGRVKAARDGVIEIAPDLAESVTKGDAYCATFLDMVGCPVAQRGFGPSGRTRRPRGPARSACMTEPVAAPRPSHRGHRRGDLGNRLRPRFRLDRSAPCSMRAASRCIADGISELPGLYFLGLQWLSRLKSSFLSGVGDDAAYLADHMPPRGADFESSLPALREGDSERITSRFQSPPLPQKSPANVISFTLLLASLCFGRRHEELRESPNDL